MRRFFLALVVPALIAVACAPEEEGAGTSPQPTATESPAPATAAECIEQNAPSLLAPDALTIGTGNPAFPPWFEGGESPDSEFQFNDPATGQGFESAVAYAVAGELGFSEDQVAWVPMPFNKSFAPGPKDFDFVLQQISFKPKRAEAVDFSASYYDVNQALVSTKGSAIEDATTLEELRDAKLGAPIGTTSLDYIEQNIQPNEEPAVYDDLATAIQDLKSGAIDGVVVDLPTAFFITAVQIPGGVIVGQFPTVGEQEYFAMAFEKGSPLVPCVDLALEALKADGSLATIQQEWLADKASAPVIEG